jgi:hypothetical protein
MVSGQPAVSTAVRAMSRACSPVVDDFGVDSGPLDQTVEHLCGQVRRVDAGQPAVALADRRAHDLDDYRFRHRLLLRFQMG